MVSTPLRSAPPCLRQPFHTRRRFIRRANRAFVVSAFFCPRRLEPTFAFAGCSLRFYLFQYPAQIRTPRKPRTSFFRFLLFSSVRTDVGFCRVLSQVLPVPVPVRCSIRRANRAPVVFALFCLRRLEPTLAFAGCSLRFYLFQYPAQIHTPRKPRTCFFRFLLSSSVRTDAGICRVLSQVLPVPVPLRRFIHRANRALVFFAFFCFRRLEPTLAFAGCSLRSYLFQYPAQIHTPRKPHSYCFRSLLSSSVRTNARFCRLLSQVLPVPVPGRSPFKKKIN